MLCNIPVQHTAKYRCTHCHALRRARLTPTVPTRPHSSRCLRSAGVGRRGRGGQGSNGWERAALMNGQQIAHLGLGELAQSLNLVRVCVW